MQTAMRITAKKQCATTTALVAQYLAQHNITICKAQASAKTQRNLRSKHIGKNVVSRSGARV
jgi:hypothetical protein